MNGLTRGVCWHHGFFFFFLVALLVVFWPAVGRASRLRDGGAGTAGGLPRFGARFPLPAA